MKKITIGLCGSIFALYFSSYADIIEDAQKKLEELKTQTEEVRTKATEKIEDLIEEITHKKAKAVEDYIVQSVQSSAAFEKAKQNPSIPNKICVEAHLVYFAFLATHQHCIKINDKFPYLKTKCAPCGHGSKQAHRKIFEALHQNQK